MYNTKSLVISGGFFMADWEEEEDWEEEDDDEDWEESEDDF
jgi:hypothetical protein